MAKRLAIVLVLAIAATAVAGPDPGQIAEHYVKLADAEPDVRESARTWLMDLKPDDLAALHDAVKAQPIKPAQAVALKPIILHILARDRYLRLPRSNRAFMGISLAPPPGALDLMMFGTDLPPDRLPGMPIYGCMSGYVAASHLNICDRLLSFTRDEQTFEFEDVPQLIALIGKCPPGIAITLHVQRGGAIIDLPITLDARPFTGEIDDMRDNNAFRQLQMQVEAETLQSFHKQFGDVPDLKGDDDGES